MTTGTIILPGAYRRYSKEELELFERARVTLTRFPINQELRGSNADAAFRSARARAAVEQSWRNTGDRGARSAPGRAAAMAKIDAYPGGRSAYFKMLATRAVEAKKRKRLGPSPISWRADES